MPPVNDNNINEPEPGSQTAAVLKDRRFKLSRSVVSSVIHEQLDLLLLEHVIAVEDAGSNVTVCE